MDDKQSTLAALNAEFERWEGLLAGLSAAQLTAPAFAENWSIKDTLAHLHAWQQRSVARVEAALHNREPHYPDWPSEFDPEAEGEPHDLNAWLYAQSRDLPWPAVHGAWRENFQQFLALADALPEADLLDASRYPWLEGYALIEVLKGTLEHHQEHAGFVEPVIARFGAGASE